LVKKYEEKTDGCIGLLGEKRLVKKLGIKGVPKVTDLSASQLFLACFDQAELRALSKMV